MLLTLRLVFLKQTVVSHLTSLLHECRQGYNVSLSFEAFAEAHLSSGSANSHHKFQKVTTFKKSLTIHLDLVF